MPTTVFNDSNISFLPQQWSFQQLSPHQVYNISSGSGSSPRSTNLSESSSSSYHDESNSSTRSPDTTTEDNSGGPYLQILEEPFDKFRFRYKTEMHGTHGTILGTSGQKKTFPKVKLCNYRPNKGDKDPIIRCSLYSVHADDSKRVAHVHRLIGKDNGEEREDPHDIVVCAPAFTAVFKNMTILFTKKEDQERVFLAKKQAHFNRRFTEPSHVHREMDIEKFRKKIREELTNINRNVACLQFEALIDRGQGFYTSLCPPVYSQPINNMKNPQTNELRICRVDRCSGSCLGGEEVFTFVEKVVKKNIKVKFYEEGPNKEIVWSDYASFTQDDVHHQYGIVFRTPPYRDPHISNDVEVFFQLERPSDKAVSDPMIFEYHPDSNRRRDMHRKRPRQDSTSNLPTMLNDFIEKPRTWNQETSNVVTSSQIPPSSAVNGLYDNGENFSDLIKDIFENPMELQGDPISNEDMLSMTSSDWSFDKAFGNIPSADSEDIMQFINSGRFYEYAVLNGEEDSAQMLMQGPKDLVLDGLSLPKSKTETKSSLPGKTSQQEQSVDKGDNGDVTNKTISSLHGKHDVKQSRRMSKLLLNESNIIEKTEKALHDLSKLRQTRKINGHLFQLVLTKIFSYTVKDSEDSVLHVLAASHRNTVPALATRCLNFLKMFNIIEPVIEKLNSNEETALHVAVCRGSVEMVNLLLDAGAKVDATDKMHNTPTHLALFRSSGSKEVVALLLAKHPILTIYNDNGCNVCHLAAYRRQPEILNSLIVKSDDFVNTENLINTRDRKRGNTALHIAVEQRFIEIVILLLHNFEGKIDVNAKNFEDKTPLAFVLGESDADSREIANLLLKYKADPTMVNLSGEDKKEDYKSDYEVEPELEIVDDFVIDSESAYAREWDANNDLFDKVTLSRLCPLLDENDNWIKLVKKLKFSESEIHVCKLYWSPSLQAFKMAASNKPEITCEVVRDELFTMGPHLRSGAVYIDDMLLHKLGLDC